jgi:topoisomerase (DNA) II binding protein 1
MKGLVVSLSGFNGLAKTELSKLIKYMGGTYFDNLTAATTHLVSNTVQSEKYEIAGQKKLKIMNGDWVKDSWSKSQLEDFHATDSEFDRYLLPIFHNLTFSSTGLPQTTRVNLQKEIESNGGKFMGAFKSEVVNILILNKEKKDSEKFRAAVKCRKDCLIPEWVFDSVKIGYALPIGEYTVSSDMKVSTPKKTPRLTSQEFNGDNTALSDISHIPSGLSTTNATINDSMLSVASVRSTRSTKMAQNNDRRFKKLLDEITPQLQKKAGLFLDGCNVSIRNIHENIRL